LKISNVWYYSKSQLNFFNLAFSPVIQFQHLPLSTPDPVRQKSRTQSTKIIYHHQSKFYMKEDDFILNTTPHIPKIEILVASINLTRPIRNTIDPGMNSNRLELLKICVRK